MISEAKIQLRSQGFKESLIECIRDNPLVSSFEQRVNLNEGIKLCSILMNTDRSRA